MSSKKSIILIGETKAGKSTLGNFLLGRDEFKSGYDIYSITKELKVEKISDNSNISVIDTPGVYDSGNKDEENFKNALNKINADKNKFNISLVLLVLNLANPSFDEKFQYMLKFVCRVFPKNLADHVGIVFTRSINYFTNEKELAKNKLGPQIMQFIKENTSDSKYISPKLFFVESVKQDYDSRSAKEKIIKLAEKLDVISEIDTRARFKSRDVDYYPVYIGKEKEKEIEPPKIESNSDSGPGFFESLNDIVDDIGALSSGYKYASSRKGGNSLLNFSLGVGAYKDMSNGTFNEDEFRRRQKEADDCNIY